VIEGLPMLFDSLTRQPSDSGDAPGWARRELLTDQLINETRLISDGAFRLSDGVTERRRIAELRGDHCAVDRQVVDVAGSEVRVVLGVDVAALLQGWRQGVHHQLAAVGVGGGLEDGVFVVSAFVLGRQRGLSGPRAVTRVRRPWRPTAR